MESFEKILPKSEEELAFQRKHEDEQERKEKATDFLDGLKKIIDAVEFLMGKKNMTEK